MVMSMDAAHHPRIQITRTQLSALSYAGTPGCARVRLMPFSLCMPVRVTSVTGTPHAARPSVARLTARRSIIVGVHGPPGDGRRSIASRTARVGVVGVSTGSHATWGTAGSTTETATGSPTPTGWPGTWGKTRRWVGDRRLPRPTRGRFYRGVWPPSRRSRQVRNVATATHPRAYVRRHGLGKVARRAGFGGNARATPHVSGADIER